MKRLLTGALAALTLGGALAGAAAPASAAPWHGGYVYRGGWHGGYGGVAAAGILGLAAGAVIADSYGPRYYGPPPVYYYGPRCRVEMRWNPGWGGYDRVNVCY
jgi:hypothetical protein